WGVRGIPGSHAPPPETVPRETREARSRAVDEAGSGSTPAFRHPPRRERRAARRVALPVGRTDGRRSPLPRPAGAESIETRARPRESAASTPPHAGGAPRSSVRGAGALLQAALLAARRAASSPRPTRERSAGRPRGCAEPARVRPFDRPRKAPYLHRRP